MVKKEIRELTVYQQMTLRFLSDNVGQTYTAPMIQEWAFEGNDYKGPTYGSVFRILHLLWKKKLIKRREAGMIEKIHIIKRAQKKTYLWWSNKVYSFPEKNQSKMPKRSIPLERCFTIKRNHRKTNYLIEARSMAYDDVFRDELLPLLKKLFPEKAWEKRYFAGTTRPVEFSVCEVNLVYDAVGLKGGNVCDKLKLEGVL